jgi:hypothetical protein
MNAIIGIMAAVLGQAVESEAELKAVLHAFYAREAGRYEFFLDEKHERRLELQKKPVLTWTNSENYMGAVYIWTYDGRPEVIGCIGSHQRGGGNSNVFHEFHSLSLQPLQPVKLGDGPDKWSPSKPGLELRPIEGAPAPADSERLRRAQMRDIAREFTGAMKDNADVTELRLLPTEIARYKSPERGVIDGAIFAFVWKGTDPEVLLIVEDRKDKEDERWHYALARFNFRDLWIKHRGNEIWRVGVSRQNEAYITGVVGATTLDRIRAAQQVGP